MSYYLIENLMGFEKPIEQGSRADLELRRREYEKEPATRKVGIHPNAFIVEASYYIVAKDEWDIEDCPLIPVDLS